MKITNLFTSHLLKILAASIVLSSLLVFSSIPQAKADTHLEQTGPQATESYVWIGSHDNYGLPDDIVALPFGKQIGYGSEVSSHINEVVDSQSNSYVLNWRPQVSGDSLQLCGLRVAYSLALGDGEFEDTIRYIHVHGSGMTSRNSNVDWASDESSGCIYLSSGNPLEIFNIHLDIPDRSRIDYLRVYYYQPGDNVNYLPLTIKP
ncbi:MAG: hypothetical protein GX797_08265 [Chloroflexi bacterium]|jgi:hypothetical protein|nr:hypothetical protein [Chloroflexota bacterium]